MPEGKWGWEETCRCLQLYRAAWRQQQFPGLPDVPKTASQGTRFCTNTLTSLGCQRGQGGWPSPQRCARLGCLPHAAPAGLPGALSVPWDKGDMHSAAVRQAGACGPRHYPDLSPFSLGEGFALRWAAARAAVVVWLLQGCSCALAAAAQGGQEPSLGRARRGWPLPGAELKVSEL